MQKLSLAGKMLALVMIPVAAIVVVAFVAIDRLSNVNARVEQLVDSTLLKREVLNGLQIQLLQALRAQKNSILSPDDEISKEYANHSESELAEAKIQLHRLRELTSAHPTERQTHLVEELAKELEAFEKVNRAIIQLSVQNSNVKARLLVSGELTGQTQHLTELFQSWGMTSPGSGEDPTATVARLQKLLSISRSVLELQVTVGAHLNSSDSDEMTALEKRIESFQDQIQQGLPAAAGGDPARQISASAQLSDIRNTVKKILALSRLDTYNRATTASLVESRVTGDACVRTISDLDQLFSDEGRQGRDLSDRTYRQARQWIQGVTASGVLAGLFVGYLVAALASALTRLVREILRLSGGVASSASGLADVSQQLLGQSEQTSHQATNVASSSEELSSNIGTMAAAAEEMSVSVASISSASEEMSMNVGTISSAAEQTSNNVNVVSTAVAEISQSFNDVLGNVREGSRVAGDARRMADSATATIQQLNQSGAEISKVTETIKMIALQTNLLALNATIEATSAGDAGKGFAVVAHEIKELAHQSAKAAEDIARKIEGVQRDTRQAVDVIQNVSQIIKDINASTERISVSVENQTRAAGMISQNVGEANKGVGDIARSIAEVAKAAGDMSRNVAEAARGATDVSRNASEAAKAAGGISSSIHSVSVASRSTNESANQVNSSAVELDRIGKELRTLVGRFPITVSDNESTKV